VHAKHSSWLLLLQVDSGKFRKVACTCVLQNTIILAPAAEIEN